MRVFKDFDEIKSAVGSEVGVSDWVIVTQDRINRFAEATGDEQWIHVDVERAKQELLVQSTIAHGLLTVSLAPEFVRSVMGLQGIKNTLNYGANRIRLAPSLARGCAAGFPSRQQMRRRRTGYGSPTTSRSKLKAVSVLLASPR